MLKLSLVAERLNCSLSNVYHLKDQGLLEVVAVGAGGKGYRVTEDSLQRYLDSVKKGRGPAVQDERRNPRPQTFRHLDGDRLHAAWRRQDAAASRPRGNTAE